MSFPSFGAPQGGAFNLTNAFSQPQATQPSAFAAIGGGGAAPFGQTTNLFGGGGNQSAFGAAPSTQTPVFGGGAFGGQQSQSVTAFGGAGGGTNPFGGVTQTAFGAPPQQQQQQQTAFGGAPATGASFGAFGQAGGGQQLAFGGGAVQPAFGQSAAGAFGGFGQMGQGNQNVRFGSRHTKYNPCIEPSTNANDAKLLLQSIVCQKDYEGKSPEELRFEDETNPTPPPANNTAAPAFNAPFATNTNAPTTTPSFTSPFGNTSSPFSQQTTTAANPFGGGGAANPLGTMFAPQQQQQQPAAGGAPSFNFGQGAATNTAPAFGNTTTPSFSFPSTTAAAPTTTNLFQAPGAAPTASFGFLTAASTTTNTAPSTTSFSFPSATSSTTTTPSFGIGTTPASGFTGLFNTNTNTNTAAPAFPNLFPNQASNTTATTPSTSGQTQAVASAESDPYLYASKRAIGLSYNQYISGTSSSSSLSSSSAATPSRSYIPRSAATIRSIGRQFISPIHRTPMTSASPLKIVKSHLDLTTAGSGMVGGGVGGGVELTPPTAIQSDIFKSRRKMIPLKPPPQIKPVELNENGLYLEPAPISSSAITNQALPAASPSSNNNSFIEGKYDDIATPVPRNSFQEKIERERIRNNYDPSSFDRENQYPNDSSTPSNNPIRHTPSPPPSIPTHPSSSIAKPAPPSLIPTLERPGYYTVPSIEELEQMSVDQLEHMNNFIIGHKEYGSIIFIGSTDITGIRFDDIIQFGRSPDTNNPYVEVYSDPLSAPPIGTKLNKDAIITLKKCFPKNYYDSEGDEREKKILLFEKQLQATAKKTNTEFISYNRSNGEWSFKVKYFVDNND